MTYPVMKPDTLYELAVWPTWIGQQVKKISGKPFKSGQKLNTVSCMMIHPITGRQAFGFNDDETFVECRGTTLVTGKMSWDDAPAWAAGMAVKCYEDDLGEWCWMSAIGSPGFICYESRPVTHFAQATDAVRSYLQVNIDFVAKNRELGRLNQSKRDKAAHDKKMREHHAVG